MLKLIYKFSQYSNQEHTLLKQLYTYNYRDHYLGYLLVDRVTKSIVSIDPGDLDAALFNIKTLEMQLGCTLRYILQSHSKSEHTKQTRQLFAKFDGVKVITGEIDQQQLMFSNEIAKDLVPFQIGELSVCFIKAPGHSFDNYMIAVTHVTETSTKIPVIFTGDTILVNSVGEISDYIAMHQTLSKLRGFHQETLLFPGHKSQKENILFAKTLEPENPLLSGKLEMENLVPTTLLEERMGNPYFRLNKMSELLKEPDPIKCMKKLRLIQNKFFNQ